MVQPSSPSRDIGNSVALETTVQRPTADAEYFSSRHAISADLSQDVDDVAPLHGAERRRKCPPLRSLARGRRRAEARLDVALGDEIPIRQHARAFDDVLQFADVAVPGGG